MRSRFAFAVGRSILFAAIIGGIFFAYKKGLLARLSDRFSDIKLPQRQPKGLPVEATQEEPVQSELDPLKSYIDQARAKGVGDREIREVLEAKGWSDEQIDSVM